ncbi:putative deoxyribose-phosphate aldolase [Talaromyces proteolyticus]|uniref:deoxyribose-phosphate aldolase n=1 Tax=Talaromyces proteolyticus TaxID=1131652 RepID=A0AAD4Q536_9EURO|nr:putative deoxyribose-phosphate aldolase [Talaromyces proteolyticus]KAH8703759.1 putative deoxyribose-phosphate aldolase [Talaromyces proteolyticus]
MATRLETPTTDPEWAALISTVKDDLPEVHTVYHTPLPDAVARSIDHTQLAVDATASQIDTLCKEAQEHKFATVCVRLPFVSRAAENLQDSKSKDVGIACVVGFHEGTYPTNEKVQEATKAIAAGASELDMVLNWPQLKQGKYTAVYADIHAVRRAAPRPRTKLKVILETSQLTRDEIITGCVISDMAGADFVKTSTGFNGAGANIENVRLMREVVDMLANGCKVKASGGIRTAEDAVEMIKAGASRIGASAGVKIVNELAGNAVRPNASTPLGGTIGGY